MICPACGTDNIEGIDRCENCLAPFRDLDIPSADASEGLARSVMEDKLSALDCDETICVAPNTPAIEVARLMKDARLGCALVLDQGKLVGIFTEHDVLLHMTEPAKSPSGKRQFVEPAIEPAAEDIPPPTIPIEGLPITDVPFGDIPLEEIRAEEQSITEPRPFPARPIGASDVCVKDLMSRDPETLHEHESVAFALNKMSLGRYRHLPVVREEGTYAVISIKNVLNYIAREDW